MGEDGKDEPAPEEGGDAGKTDGGGDKPASSIDKSCQCCVRDSNG